MPSDLRRPHHFIMDTADFERQLHPDRSTTNPPIRCTIWSLLPWILSILISRSCYALPSIRRLWYSIAHPCFIRARSLSSYLIS